MILLCTFFKEIKILIAENYEVSGFRFKVVFRKDGGDEIRSLGTDFTWANGWTERYESKVHWQTQGSEYESIQDLSSPMI